MKDYDLYVYDQSESYRIWLRGPDVEDFQAFCNARIPEAAERAYQVEKDLPYPFLTYDRVLEHLADLLVEKYGFERAEPAQTAKWSGMHSPSNREFCGGGGMDPYLGELYEKLAELNDTAYYEARNYEEE